MAVGGYKYSCVSESVWVTHSVTADYGVGAAPSRCEQNIASRADREQYEWGHTDLHVARRLVSTHTNTHYQGVSADQ